MSAFEAVYAQLESTGIPFAYMAFPKGSAPSLPWGVYYLDEEDGVYADDARYGDRCLWCVEVYARTLDNELISKVESALAGFGPAQREDTWVDSENCLMTTLSFTTITTNGQKE